MSCFLSIPSAPFQASRCGRQSQLMLASRTISVSAFLAGFPFETAQVLVSEARSLPPHGVDSFLSAQLGWLRLPAVVSVWAAAPVMVAPFSSVLASGSARGLGTAHPDGHAVFLSVFAESPIPATLIPSCCCCPRLAFVSSRR